jgi:shikimate kinase
MFQQNSSYILSTGGGTPCFHDNMDWMNQQGITIWLDVHTQILTQRLVAEKINRPLINNLSDDEIGSFIIRQFWERLKFYQKATYHLQDEQINDAAFQKIIESNE